MVGNIALRGVSGYGGDNLPKPTTAIILYTAQSGTSKEFPPTFMAVSADDPIVNVPTMDQRVQDLKSDGVEVEYHRFKNAGHGFGLGKGSDADGWMEQAIAFWGKHLK
jgi:acetyl esterase/lipase